MTAPERIALLGATGSIGGSTLSVIERNPERYEVVSVSAQRDAKGLFDVCRRHQPALAVLGDADAAWRLEELLADAGLSTRVATGEESLNEAATLGDTTVSGIVGGAGLAPTLAAIRAGRRVLLANKEPLVMAGALVMAEAAAHGAELLPVDSEHNAIFQCLPAGYRCGTRPQGVEGIVLTASGGPFRELPLEQFDQVTPEQAVTHPNWDMGRKISVDSATMMNKGLEVIEAAMLFDLPEPDIQVVLHPQSTVHSLVRYSDGSLLAQLGEPDMRTPIASALAWPARIDAGVKQLDLVAAGRLDFAPMDAQRYPCLGLARDALRAGGCLPLVLNAANEVAVARFLAGEVRFTDIARLVSAQLEVGAAAQAPDNLADIVQLDDQVRRQAAAWQADSHSPRVAMR